MYTQVLWTLDLVELYLFQALSLGSGKNMVIAHQNVQSLPGKCDDIVDIILGCDIDIFGLSETWLDKSISTNYIQLPGYITCRRDRNRHGGGVALFVRDRMRSRERTDLDHPDLESVWVEIQLNRPTRHIVIACVYIPPGTQSTALGILDAKLEVVMSENKQIIILGDLNCNLNQALLPCTRQLSDICQRYLLSSCIEGSTRVGNHSESSLDVLLSTKSESMISSGSVLTSLSDHHLIFGVLQYRPALHHCPTFLTRSIKRFDNAKFLEDLSAQP